MILLGKDVYIVTNPKRDKMVDIITDEPKWVKELDKDIEEMYEIIFGCVNSNKKGGDILSTSLGMAKGMELAKKRYEENK